MGFLRELLLVIIGAIIVSSLLRAFVGQMFIIHSDSMQNTLFKGDRVVVQKITAFHRGDVVVFADPDHWLGHDEAKQRGPVGKVFEFIGVLPDTSTGHLIKRVIGMPGDQVVCCDAKGRITVNGTALNEKSYLYTSPQGGPCRCLRSDVHCHRPKGPPLRDGRPPRRQRRLPLPPFRPVE